MVDPTTQERDDDRACAVGDSSTTHLKREAMLWCGSSAATSSASRWLVADAGVRPFRMRILGPPHDMFIVRGVNVYPSASWRVVGQFPSRVTVRARVVREGSAVMHQPPVGGGGGVERP